MLRRDNGLDWYDVEYVRRQNLAFKLFAEYFNLRVYEIDFDQSWTDQQEEVLQIIVNIYNSVH